MIENQREGSSHYYMEDHKHYTLRHTNSEGRFERGDFGHPKKMTKDRKKFGPIFFFER